jgi:hypothetical protein
MATWATQKGCRGKFKLRFIQKALKGNFSPKTSLLKNGNFLPAPSKGAAADPLKEEFINERKRKARKSMGKHVSNFPDVQRGSTKK